MESYEDWGELTAYLHMSDEGNAEEEKKKKTAGELQQKKLKMWSAY